MRRDEVSLCHTFAEAKNLIDAINHPGIQHIAGDVFHMLVGEEHIGKTILNYGHMMTNLHLADTNRRALGTGMLDLDIVIMALYVAGYNNDRCFCFPSHWVPEQTHTIRCMGAPTQRCSTSSFGRLLRISTRESALCSRQQMRSCWELIDHGEGGTRIGASAGSVGLALGESSDYQ